MSTASSTSAYRSAAGAPLPHGALALMSDAMFMFCLFGGLVHLTFCPLLVLGCATVEDIVFV